MLGTLEVIDEGFPIWRGQYITTLCQFRDNIVLSRNAPPQACADIVNTVRGVLEQAWKL